MVDLVWTPSARPREQEYPAIDHLTTDRRGRSCQWLQDRFLTCLETKGPGGIGRNTRIWENRIWALSSMRENSLTMQVQMADGAFETSQFTSWRKGSCLKHKTNKCQQLRNPEKAVGSNVHHINASGDRPNRVHRIPGFRPIPQSIIDVDRHTNETPVVTCIAKSRFAAAGPDELIDNWADHHLDLPTCLYGSVAAVPTRDINHHIAGSISVSSRAAPGARRQDRRIPISAPHQRGDPPQQFRAQPPAGRVTSESESSREGQFSGLIDSALQDRVEEMSR